ncbi:phosphoenolpyruvate carboxykinase (ATP) [Alkaliphilus hydrothermalis]|uniref:Phosphoenolpyruvate carboxykinase (ATP) n=1 Tax=Alkaliphilus hydrothermalis TaxID=1482730 RepID=A0ABS2NPL6_9FIRM|nr:phosphoenolpyruvate carboxykinase (ATP) [Alkaliphilus hydrothermalis]MBM7614875.1 phosphoenolpyruvate carboxykinase (ATP) [Alkaliphilus hydrothermalis]
MYNTKESSILEVQKLSKVYYNLSIKELMDIAVKKEGGKITTDGALCINTGKYTGRSPNDRFIVDEDSVHKYINWNKTNLPISKEAFEGLYRKALEYMEMKELYVFDGFVGADANYRIPIRVINEFAYQNLFAQQMFIKGQKEKLENFAPEFTVVALPDFKAIPEVDGTNSEVFIIISFEKKLVLIGGTKYSGEIKKSIFTVMNYLLPFKKVLPMHCSANVGEDGDVTLFFGLSGTGKTTLSADDNRRLIGDDEHGWTDHGVFNFEGGCYAKCINLSQKQEPQIWNAIKEGAILENVVIDEEGRPDYSDDCYTENTRVAFPVEHIENAVLEGRGGIPKTIIFLTADATGVLPPISKLTKEQAMYHFMSGYTSKLAGTERGIVEPTATFSTCFGGPFMILKPQVYAELLGEKIEQYNVDVFLVNTGWTGGTYGKGSRMKLKYTRSMVRAAIEGRLDQISYVTDPIFKLQIPIVCPEVPSNILNPSNTWGDIREYKEKATALAYSFHENFKQFKSVSEEAEKVDQERLLKIL